MDNNKQVLVNHIQQKFVRIAKRARQKDWDGKDNSVEFACLKRLHALLFFLGNKPNPSYEELRDTELEANEACGRESFPYKPLEWAFMDFVPVESGSGVNPPMDACLVEYKYDGVNPGNDTVCSYLDYIMDELTYEHPWIKFTTVSGHAPGKYEVGSPDLLTRVSVTVNKLALDYYRTDFGGQLEQHARELRDNLPDRFVRLDFGVGTPRRYELKGWYSDLQKHGGKHLPAETSMVWESVWPCYYGTGPVDALDDPAQRNTFIRSLKSALECPECFEEDIPDGQVLWYFYPYYGGGKLFKSENAVMAGSFKGFMEGFRTKSMDDYGIAGGMDYGVIRTAHEGIGCLSVCVVNICGEVEVFPDDPVYNPDVDEVVYAPAWTNMQCVREGQTYTHGVQWMNMQCVKVTS